MNAARGPRAVPLTRAPATRRATRLLAAFLFAGALLARALPAAGGAGDLRTLVVRGRVLAPDGTPVAGARVLARGSASTTATTDDRGRYSLAVPIGSAAGLRRGAFTLEVRAEMAGRRLAMGAGASALGIEVALAAGGGRVRVRSNSQEATTALATAFAQDGPATAWVEADFGGAARPGGPPVLSAVDEVALDGSPALAPHESAGAVPAAHSRPATAAPPAPLPAPRSAPTDTQGAASRAPRAGSVPDAGATPPGAPARALRAPATPDTAGAARAREAHAARAATRAAALRRTRAERDSARAARAARARAARAPRLAVSVTPAPAPVPVAPPPAAIAPAAPRVASAPERAESADTCACRVRGTVEVDWERPLERNFPVELYLEGPATQRGEVDLFIGSPREFRFGPLPCGDYRLAVRSRGRLHFELESGDSVLALSCHGLTQARVVIVPARH